MVAFRDRRVRPSDRGKGERKREPPRGGASKPGPPAHPGPMPARRGGNPGGGVHHRPERYAVLVEGGAGPGAILGWGRGEGLGPCASKRRWLLALVVLRAS